MKTALQIAVDTYVYTFRACFLAVWAVCGLTAAVGGMAVAVMGFGGFISPTLNAGVGLNLLTGCFGLILVGAGGYFAYQLGRDFKSILLTPTQRIDDLALRRKLTLREEYRGAVHMTILASALASVSMLGAWYFWQADDASDAERTLGKVLVAMTILFVAGVIWGVRKLAAFAPPEDTVDVRDGNTDPPSLEHYKG